MSDNYDDADDFFFEDEDDRCTKHGIDNCMQCGVEADELAERHRARQDFDHFHPSE